MGDINSDSTSIKAGDTVEVRKPPEIIGTLDADGSLDDLPFMPEMLEYCGKTFRVTGMASRTCVAFMNAELTLRMAEFRNDDVFFLDGPRCTGFDHDGCDRSCRIFWKAAWLRKVDSRSASSASCSAGAEELRKRLKTRGDERTYFCQSTQLGKATGDISRTQKFIKLCEDFRSGACTGADAVMATTRPVAQKIIGKLKRPPAGARNFSHEILNLRPGELVEVRSFIEIEDTLDAQGKNRGLAFVPDMKRYCGMRFRVRRRIERMIHEHSGEMVEVKGTVLLEENTCTYDHTFGGCPRNEFNYWREVWLKRVEPA